MKGHAKQPKFVDLFAGCGGLSLGLEQAGFFPVYVNELNDDARETYLINREHLNPLLRKHSSADIKELVLDSRKLRKMIKDLRDDYGIDCDKGELDAVVGGPPCQGFSGIGHRRSFSVDREQLPSNHLYQDMAFVIRKLQPKLFLFENVRGLLNARWTKEGAKGEIWKEVLSTFRGIPGYDVDFSLIFAKDYGVPQNRPRVLLVGIRKDLEVKLRLGRGAVERGLLPEPSGKYPDLEDLLGDLVDDSCRVGGVTTRYPAPARTAIQRELRLDPRTGKRFGAGGLLTEQQYSNHSPAIVSKFKYMQRHNGEIPESMRTKKFAQRLLPPKWGASGPSITAASLADDYVHYSQPRVLTVREWARLQTFPDWYRFAGKRTTGGIRRAGNPREGLHDREVPKYTQIGNAVPVRLARAIGEHFVKLLRST